MRSLHHHQLPGAGHAGIGYQVNPTQTLADATAYQVGHLGQRVFRASIVPALKLGDVAGKVLAGHPAIDPYVPAFEQCPEGFHPVGVGHVLDVFAYAVRLG